MGLSLYEITDAIAQRIRAAEETGELTPEDAGALDALDMAFEEKIENCAKMVRTLESEAGACAEEADLFFKNVRARENAAKWLKGYMLDGMIRRDIPKIRGKLLSVAVQNSPASVNVLDEGQVPKSYFTQPAPVLNKGPVLEALKRGEAVPGAELKVGQHVRIR